jgi:3'(2'), 5'-bisphosphate nucleotidase
MNVDLVALEDLALAAGREIMDVYAGDFETISKTDGSPVTVADHRAEAVILKGLAEITPGVPAIAEEQMEAGKAPKKLGDLFYLVDPLDGTRGFAERTGDEFTVNIGLIRKGAPIAGVVYAPARGELYSGTNGAAFFTPCDVASAKRSGAREPIHVVRSEAMRALTSRTSRSATEDRFLANVGAVDLHPMSSSIKFCIVAAGKAALYPRFGTVNEWDAAAGHAILEAAGGGVMLRNGQPLVYGLRAPDFAVRGFVAHAGGDIEDKVRTALRS